MRVLLADDHALMLEGLQNLLEAHGIEVAGTARDGREAVEQARKLRPDVILMDIRMPVWDGITATRVIKAEMPETKIVVLTTSAESEDLFEAVKSGATGYLLKSMDAESLIDALHDAEQDVPPFAPGLAARLLAQFATLSESRPDDPARRAEPATCGEEPLSARQLQVLDLVVQGLSYKEVGDRVCLSPRTVKYHMAEIMRKLHLQNRAQVLAYAGALMAQGETPDAR
jgi:DNA-binding NarL/FixJ family response regulator